jgi:hypothetical protein
MFGYPLSAPLADDCSSAMEGLFALYMDYGLLKLGSPGADETSLLMETGCNVYIAADYGH